MRTRNIKKWGTAAAFVATGWTNSYAIDSSWINQKLHEFEASPKQFIHNQKNVQKYHPITLKPIRLPPRFSEESIQSGEFILIKDAMEKTARSFRKKGRAPIRNNDRPEQLVDELKYNRLQDMEEAGLRSSDLPTSPWSDDYWPIYQGIIAKRYADSNFPNSQDWAVNVNYITSSRCSLDERSPAEKYDLLVGDRNWTLTKAMLKEGQSYYSSTGKVEPWMGMCHGWAPASFMMPRPTKSISVAAADGRAVIRFYPSDIKALATLLWANAAPGSRFIGGRCNERSPREDEVGHIIDSDCFETNPGTWHQVVVNQIGVSKRSFIMDATYDYEVWNQPVYGYEYSYFNPALYRGAHSLEDAIVSRAQFRNDKFWRYRSKNSAYIVGVAMKLVYASETLPSHKSPDSPDQDRKIAVNYIYDLELDQNFNIVGGEWYNRQHPDFLWLHPPGARAVSVGDRYLDRSETARSNWDPRQPIPAEWLVPAQKASASKQPLAKIVEGLIVLSHLSE